MASNNEGLSLPVGVTEQKALKQLARIESRALKVQRQAERNFVRSNQRVARSFGTMSNSARGNLQNVSYQLQDIFVQISSGQGATRALSQQLPQLLSGFGVLGSVLGLAAAAGLPLGAMLLDIGEGAETAEESVTALAAAVKELKSATDLATQSPADLLNQYGGLADEAKQLFDITRQIAAIRAQGALDDAARGIAGELGVAGVFGFGPDEIRDLEGTIASLKRELNDLNSTPAIDLSDSELAAANREIEQLEENLSNLKTVSKNVDDLADTLGVSEEAAREVVAQFALIGQAKGPEEQAQAIIDLADYINGASNNLADAEEEGKALYQQLLDAAIQALELSKVDIANTVTAGADAAERLKNELAAALALQNNINQQGSKVYSGRGGDPRVVGNDGYTRELGYKTVDEIIAQDTKRTSSGGGGGSSRLPDGMREAQHLFDSTRTEAERYAAEVERINELHRMFPEIVTAEVRDRAIGALQQGVDGLTREVESMNAAFADTFADIITGAESASEALSGLLSKFAGMMAQSAFSTIGGNLLGSLGIPGFATGNLLGSLGIPGFATGTNFAPGGPALVGERGVELVNLPRGSQVFSAEKTKRMLSGGDGVTVQNTFNISGGAANDVDSLKRELIPLIERVSVSSVANARRRGAAV